MCIQEHRYTHSEYIKYHDSSNGWTLANASAWKNSLNATIGGVDILIGPWALKSLNSIKKIQLRMMVATFNGNLTTTINHLLLQPYVREETDLIALYSELSSLVHSIPKHNILVIGGDMNAQIGQNINYKFSLHDLSNRNGKHITDFSLENRFTCLNTEFLKRKGKLWNMQIMLFWFR